MSLKHHTIFTVSVTNVTLESSLSIIFHLS